MTPRLHIDLMTSARSKNFEKFKSALTELSAQPDSFRRHGVGNLLPVIMGQGWTEGLEAILSMKTDVFPNGGIRENLPNMMANVPVDGHQMEGMLGVLASHAHKMDAGLKADIAFEVAPFIKQDLFERCRHVGLFDASKSTRINHRLHGASQSNEASPERVAAFIADMPVETKAQIYNAYLTDGKSVKAFARPFLTAVMKDPVFFDNKLVSDKKFKIDKEFISEPEFASVLIQKNMLSPDQAFTAFWRNPDNAQLAQALTQHLNTALKTDPKGIEPAKYEGWLRLIGENLTHSTDPTVRNNASLVASQMRENIGLPKNDVQATPKIA